MTNDEARIQVINDCKGNCRKIQVFKFATETAFEYKYQIAMKTAEWNTSKQVSAKETTLRSVYKYSRIIFSPFFLKQSECRETELRKWIEGISGS